MKPLASGDLLKSEGCLNTTVQARVDTIEYGEAVLYKYQVFTEWGNKRDYHLAWQMFIGDEKVREHINCHKFLTKRGFKELCQHELTEHFKRQLNISDRVAS